MSKRWTKSELEMLQSMVGDFPWVMLPDRYNARASSNGWPTRSEIGLRRKCEDLRLSRRCVGEWITAGMVRRLMNVSYETVSRWVRRGYLIAFKPSTVLFIRRDSLCAMAIERPQYFGGQSRSVLVQLLDNESLADSIVAMKLPSPKQRRAVLCVETGRRFETISEAARSVYVTYQRLQRAIREGQRSVGFHWRYL